MSLKVNILTAITISAAAFMMTSCDQKDPTPVTPPSIEITSATPINSAATGGCFIVNYTITNPVEGVTLTTSTESDWITTYPAEADQISFCTSENKTFESREGIITLAYEGAESIDLKVIQEAATPPTLIISPTSFEVGASGGTYSANYIIENPVEGASFTITPDVEWVSYSVSAYSIDFIVQANELEEAREASVTVEYPGVESYQITISQEAKQQEVQSVAVNITEAELMSDYGNELEIWFYDDKGDCYVFDVLVGLSNGVLPDGTYSIEAGTMSNRYCTHKNFTIGGKIKVATLTVANANGASTFDIDWVYEDVNYSIDWTGQVKFFDYSNIN